MSHIRRLARLPLSASLLLVTLVAAACGGSSASSSSSRPHSNAQLIIVSPTPNQVTGSTVTLQLNLVGARVVPPGQLKGKLRGDEGHIHVFLDKLLVSMAFGLTQQVNITNPGSHVLRAEFVAVDHRPFSPGVVTAVIFQSQ